MATTPSTSSASSASTTTRLWCWGAAGGQAGPVLQRHDAVGQVRGQLSRAGTRDAAAYERANYVSLLTSATHGPSIEER
jgi:hypothetical protein